MEDEAIKIYENIVIYLFLALDILMICLFCRTLRSRNIKVYAINSENKVKVQGYTKTVNNVDDERRPRPQLGEVAVQKEDAQKVYGFEPEKEDFEDEKEEEKKQELKEEKKEDTKSKDDQSLDQSQEKMNLYLQNEIVGGENNLNKQENNNGQNSFSSSYCSTITKKHRLLSPMIYDHPTMSFFSRGILLTLSISVAMIVPVLTLLVVSGIPGVLISVILSFTIMRALAIPVEAVLIKRQRRMLNRIQLGLVILIIIIQVLVAIIGSMIDSNSFGDLSMSIVGFLVIELIVYELIIHIFHVKIARTLVQEPSKLIKNRLTTKYFLNPLVYDSINYS